MCRSQTDFFLFFGARFPYFANFLISHILPF